MKKSVSDVLQYRRYFSLHVALPFVAFPVVSLLASLVWQYIVIKHSRKIDMDHEVLYLHSSESICTSVIRYAQLYYA